MNMQKIIEDAIPLDMKCEQKRKAEIQRRAKLKINIEELISEEKKKQPYHPELNYKS